MPQTSDTQPRPEIFAPDRTLAPDKQHLFPTSNTQPRQATLAPDKGHPPQTSNTAMDKRLTLDKQPCPDKRHLARTSDTWPGRAILAPDKCWQHWSQKSNTGPKKATLVPYKQHLSQTRDTHLKHVILTADKGHSPKTSDTRCGQGYSPLIRRLIPDKETCPGQATFARDNTRPRQGTLATDKELLPCHLQGLPG